MIIVSPGHNHYARGASYEGFCEYPETLLWANLIAEELKLMGRRVVVLKEKELKDKVKKINDICKEEKQCFAIEVHFNGAKSKSVSGCETLYYPNSEKGKLLACCIQSKIKKVFPPDRGVKEGWYQQNKTNGIVNYLLRATNCPTVIVEPEFVSQYEDIIRKHQEGCKQIAEGVFQAYNILCERGFN